MHDDELFGGYCCELFSVILSVNVHSFEWAISFRNIHLLRLNSIESTQIGF